MTRVGALRVIGTQRLLIPDGEESWMSFDWVDPSGPDSVEIQLTFEGGADGDSSPSLRLEGKGDHGRVVFVNWNNPLGQSIAAPITFASTNAGEDLSMLAAMWMIGKLRIVEVQIMVGGVP